MPFMIWTDAVATGFDEIDRQHRELFSLINKLHDAAVGGAERDASVTLLNALADYVVKHFDVEEGIMEAAGYPDIHDHKKQHHHARQVILNFRNDYLDGRVVLNTDVLEFLKDWLNKHILGTDFQYVPFLRSRGMA